LAAQLAHFGPILGRVPNDIDLVVSAGRSEYFDPEDIKEIIVNADNRYFLEPSKRRNANHKVLYCRLPGWSIEGRCVKIDILVPPTLLEIPRIFSSNAFLIDDIPVMPLFDLLVMKVQGWRDHNTSLRPDFGAKVGADVADVRALLNRAISERIWYPREKGHHPREFMDRARSLAFGFIQSNGGREKFQTLGFPV